QHHYSQESKWPRVRHQTTTSKYLLWSLQYLFVIQISLLPLSLLRASQTLSGVKGSERILTPYFLRMALATAGAIGRIAPSPIPREPNGPGPSSCSIKYESISGVCSIEGTL